jgi:hypothetical protein
MKGLWGLATFAVIALLGSLMYMKSSYGTTEPCVAMTRAVAEEMPAALDELARRYPLKVGIARGLSSYLLDDADARIEELTDWAMTESLRDESPSPMQCFGTLLIADLDRASLRSSLVDGLEKSFGLAEQDKAAARRQPARTPATAYLTCLVNRTPGDVHFSYRWGERGDWQAITLKQGYNRWFSNDENIAFMVRFDNAAADGYQGVTYTLERTRSSERECDSARRYDFRWDSGTLKLYGG